LAIKESLNVHFTSLSKSIRHLQKASVALDKERNTAQKELENIVKKWKKTGTKTISGIRHVFGNGFSCPHQGSKEGGVSRVPRDGQTEDEILLGILLHIGFHVGTAELKTLSQCHKLPLKRLRKLVKKIQVLNKKASAFEKGFISEAGIKDREWYKHLVVAPGKWLGL